MGDHGVPTNATSKANADEHFVAGVGSQPREPDQFELRQLLSTLGREKRLVFSPFILAMVGLFFYLGVTPRYYSATAQILIDIQKPRIISSEAVVPSLDTTRYMIDPVIDSQVEIMRSNRIAEKVIERMGLAEDPYYLPQTTLIGSLRGWLSSLTSFHSPPAEEAEENDGNAKAIPTSVVAAFLRNLDVRRKGLTLILYVQFTDRRPAKAAAIANAVVDAYLDDQREQKIGSARLANDLLKARVAELRDQVLAAENRLQEYREKNNLISIDGVTVGEHEITATITQLIAARTNAANKLAELRQVEEMSQNPEEFTSISKVLDSDVIRGLRLQESAVLRNIASNVAKFGENDSRVETGRAELNNIRNDISQEIARIIENARHDYDVAQSQVRILQAAFNDLKRDSAVSRRLTIEFAELERDAKSSRDLYLNLLSRLKVTLVQESLLYPDARLVETAVKPRAPSSPKKLMLLALTFMGSLGMGITLALVKDQLSNVIRTPREMEQLLGSQVTLLPLLPNASSSIASVAVDEPDSAFTQAIFSINRSLWKHLKSPKSRCIVAVTSAMDGEGKTTIALNLANYSAMLEVPTLLIDCDFRSNGASNQFPTGGDDKSTLVDLLLGTAKPGEAIERIEPSGFDLCRTPRPGSVRHPMELLSSVQMRRVLQQLRRKYKLIILDTSAILTSVDARALIGFADCAVFVSEASETSADQVLQAQRAASDLADKTAMVVLNKSEMKY